MHNFRPNPTGIFASLQQVLGKDPTPDPMEVGLLHAEFRAILNGWVEPIAAGLIREMIPNFEEWDSTVLDYVLSVAKTSMAIGILYGSRAEQTKQPLSSKEIV